MRSDFAGSEIFDRRIRGVDKRVEIPELTVIRSLRLHCTQVIIYYDAMSLPSTISVSQC
jgi:hypothetical protein